jgi:hypothetical protein
MSKHVQLAIHVQIMYIWHMDKITLLIKLDECKIHVFILCKIVYLASNEIRIKKKALSYMVMGENLLA